MYINVSIDLSYKEITSMITYFVAVASKIWRVKSLEPLENFAQVATLYKHPREVNLFLKSF